MRHPHSHTDGRFAGPSFDTTDPTAQRGRNRRRRGDFPEAPYEEGFDPRRGGPRGAFPHEHHEHRGAASAARASAVPASAPADRAASAVPVAAAPAVAPVAVTSAPRSCCSSPRSPCTATS